MRNVSASFKVYMIRIVTHSIPTLNNYTGLALASDRVHNKNGISQSQN